MMFSVGLVVEPHCPWSHLGIPNLKQQNCLGSLEKQKHKLFPGIEDLPGPAPLLKTTAMQFLGSDLVGCS